MILKILKYIIFKYYDNIIMHLYVYTTQSRPYEFKYGIFKKNNYKRIFTGQSYFGEKIIIKYLYKIHKEFDYNFYKLNYHY